VKGSIPIGSMKNKSAQNDKKYNFSPVDYKLTWGGAAGYNVRPSIIFTIFCSNYYKIL
jgi:hypothetical protein